MTSQDTDDIEFFNFGDTAVDLSGWTVTDDNLLRTDFYTFPAGTILAPGAYLVRRNPEHFAFGLGGADQVNLFDDNGDLVDTTGWASGAAVVSWCRIPNGTGSFRTCSARTFDAANVP